MTGAGAPKSRALTAILFLVLLLGGTATGLAIAEIVSRLVLGSYNPHFPLVIASEMDIDRRHDMSREDNGARCTFDADGFRAEGSPGSPVIFDRTVLFIGDSFTLGFGVVDGASFAAQTGRALTRQGVSVRPVNAGNSGAGTAQELRLLRRLLDRMKVDLIVLQVFPHNDLQDNWEDGGFTVTSGRLMAVSPPRQPMHIVGRRWLADHDELNELNVVRLLANALLAHDHFEVTDEAVELERLLLRETVATARSAGIPIFLLIVGDQTECGSAAPDGHRSGRHDAYDRVLDVAGAIDAPSLSSCAITRDARHYNMMDGHFNAAGNRLIGDALAERIAPLLRAAPVPQTPGAGGSSAARSSKWPARG